jgi:hypothetical protein
MKTTVKILISCLIMGGSIAGFAQTKPTKEYVTNIPEGRNILMQPIFKNEGHIKGKVAIDFTINKKGDVIAAHTSHKGTTIRNKVFLHRCEKAVRGAKFSELKTAPESQHGSLAYTFKDE